MTPFEEAAQILESILSSARKKQFLEELAAAMRDNQQPTPLGTLGTWAALAGLTCAFDGTPKHDAWNDLDEHDVWDGIDEQYRFMATDLNGSVYVFTDEPKDRSNKWTFTSGQCELVRTEDSICMEWRKSLLRRASNEVVPEKESHIWEGIEERYRFMATDRDGTTWLYEAEPSIVCGIMWGADNGCRNVYYNPRIPKISWEASLRKRGPISDEKLLYSLAPDFTHIAMNADGSVFAYRGCPRHSIVFKKDEWVLDFDRHYTATRFKENKFLFKDTPWKKARLPIAEARAAVLKKSLTYLWNDYTTSGDYITIDRNGYVKIHKVFPHRCDTIWVSDNHSFIVTTIRDDIDVTTFWGKTLMEREAAIKKEADCSSKGKAYCCGCSHTEKPHKDGSLWDIWSHSNNIDL